MPGFSFTAPRISPEEELLERNSLSDAEINDIKNDIYGVHDNHMSSFESQTGRDMDINKFWKSVENIPYSRKRAYLEAMKISPEVVNMESDPVAFLLCEQCDAVSAANKLVTYWDFRLQLFGSEKAFLPMTLTGAMAEEARIVKEGPMQILPNDGKGRAVLYFDSIQATTNCASRETLARVMFYMCQILAEQPQAHTMGYIFLENVENFDLYKHFDRILIKNIKQIMSIMPTKLKAMHICGGDGSAQVNMVLPVMKQMLGKYIRLRTLYHHGPKDEVLTSLETYSLYRSGLCRRLGGDFSREEFHFLLKNREETIRAKKGVIMEVHTVLQ